MIKFDNDGEYSIEFEDFGYVSLNYAQIKSSEIARLHPYLLKAVKLQEYKTYSSAGLFLYYLDDENLSQLESDLFHGLTEEDADVNHKGLDSVVLLCIILLMLEGHSVKNDDPEMIQKAIDSLRLMTTIMQRYKQGKLKGKILMKNFSLVDSLDLPLVE